MIRDHAIARHDRRRTASPLHLSFSVLGDWIALARQRRQLKSLDARALNDMGLSADDARREATRPAWDVPAHWRR